MPSRDRRSAGRPAPPRPQGAARGAWRRLRGARGRLRHRPGPGRRRTRGDPDRRFLRAANEAGRAAGPPSDPDRPPHPGGTPDRARRRRRRGALHATVAQAPGRDRDLRGPRVLPHAALAPAPDDRDPALPRGPHPRARPGARAALHARPGPAAADRGALADRAQRGRGRRPAAAGTGVPVHDARAREGDARPAPAGPEDRRLPARARGARAAGKRGRAPLYELTSRGGGGGRRAAASRASRRTPSSG